MDMPEEDPVVCVLRSSTNEAPYLNRSDIVRQLSPPLKFKPQMYEVGLRSVSYFPNKRASTSTVKRNERKKSRVYKKKILFHEKIAPPGPLFPGLQPPQVIKTVPVVKGEQEDLDQFISRFNKDIGPAIKVNLLLSGTTNGRIVLVKFEPTDVQEILLLTPHFAKLLGHRRQQFHTGKYVGNDVVTPVDYRRLSVNTDLTIQIVKFPYKDSMITLHEQFDAVRSFRKRAMTYEQFFNFVSASLATDGNMITFTFDANKKVTMDVKVTVITDPRNYVVLPLEIRDCLGFQQDQFPTGTYTSERAIDVAKFTAIPGDQDLYFRFKAYSWLYQMMNEPKSLHIRDVLDELNLSFTRMRSQEYPIQFYYDDGHLVLDDTRVSADVEITFPKPLTKYLGIPETTKMNGGSRIPLGNEVTYEEEEIEYEEQNQVTPVRGEPRRLLICSDLAKAMTYGNQQVNLLREIPLTYDLNTEVNLDFSPVMYLPLDITHINLIRINFKDEFLRPVEFQNKNTSVTIEIRRKF